MPFCSLEAYIAVSQPILNRNTEPDLYAKPTTASIRNWTYILFRQKPGKADECGGRDSNPGSTAFFAGAWEAAILNQARLPPP